MEHDPSEQDRESPHCVAVIGDMVSSQRLTTRTRFRIQAQFSLMLAELNQAYRSAILSRFTITLGDEFQGLLHDPGVLPDLTMRMWMKFPDVEIRLGIGWGELATPLERDAALGMDGPAFYRARAAIEVAKKRKVLGGVYHGFGEDDLVLDGISRIMHEHRSRWSVQQRQVVQLIKEEHSRTEIAEIIHATPQAVHARVRSSGWPAYQEAERALAIVLARYTTSQEWNI